MCKFRVDDTGRKQMIKIPR